MTKRIEHANRFHIGEVTRRTGASRKAIHFYESLGLLPDVQRDANRYRVYTDHHVVLVQMIQRAQTVGFKLADLETLIHVKMQTNHFPVDMALDICQRMRISLQQKREQIRQQESELQALVQELEYLRH